MNYIHESMCLKAANCLQTAAQDFFPNPQSLIPNPYNAERCNG